MEEYSIYITPTRGSIILSLCLGCSEVLPPRSARAEHAAQVVLAGPSRWLDTRLFAVLCADDQAASSWPGLIDELGCGDVVYDTVEVRHPRPGAPQTRTAAERTLQRFRGRR